MPRFALGLLLGVMPLARLAVLPPVGVALALAAMGLALLLGERGRFMAGLALGFALALLAAHTATANRLPVGLEGHDLVVTGRIIDLPVERGHHSRFRLVVTAAMRAGEPVNVPARLRLNWYGADRPRLRPGEIWRLPVRIKRARGFANPGTFDYARWLLRQGIGATGYVHGPAQARRLDAGGPSFDRLRFALRARLRALLPDNAIGGILLALALGQRGDIAPRAWSVLRATGTTHLVAISGLHIGLVALFGFLLGRVAWRGLGRWRDRCPRPLVQAWLALVLAAAYAALAGFALPTVRALLMLAVALFAFLRRRGVQPFEVLAWAAIAVVLFDPLAPLGASFWLSFTAVATILWLVTGRIAPAPRVHRWFSLQFGIALALAPLLLAFFGQASLIAPLANAVAIPWVSFLVAPPTLAATALTPLWPAAAHVLFTAAGMALTPLWHLLSTLAGWPLAQWHAPQYPGALLALAAFGGFLLVAPRGFPGRTAGLLALVPLLAWSPPRPPPGAVWFTLLDVGQGLAAVVRTHAHVLVYDTGPRFSARFDAGSAVVVPYLRARGVERIDTLVLSHLDNDHAGGRAAVIKQLRPRRVWSSVPQGLRVPARLCVRGDGWAWDGVRFDFLHPVRATDLHGNNASCVLRVRAAGGSLLLPGDIEAPAEHRLLARGDDVDVDVVVAPHHGSNSSSTPAFVRAVDPRWVLYPVGYHNRWDFPRPAVVRRWRPAGSAGTDCAGAIRLRIDPRGGVAAPRGWRQTAPRFWRAGCAGGRESATMRAVDAAAANAARED